MQEWEKNAARHVTLRAQLDDVSRLIIDFRRLELQSWRTCLDSVQRQAERRAARWWFFIYALIDGHLHPTAEQVFVMLCGWCAFATLLLIR